MKVGILTFHDVFNPGAFLQALGTQTLVQSMGHDAYIIDYTAPRHRFSVLKYLKGWNWRVLYRFPLLMNMILKERAFKTARKQLLNRTRFFEQRSDLANESFDLVLIGADVVWNFKHAYLGRDPVYFGDQLNRKCLLSFAASFGDCSLKDEIPEYVREGLKEFDGYSVRDANTADIVEACVGERPLQICDPAFHLDLEAIIPPPVSAEPYVLVYLRNGAFSTALKDEVLRFAKRKGLKIIATYYTHSWADKNYSKLEPQDWVGLIRDAAYVVTNTFHGSVFSILLEKHFVVDYNEGILLKTAGMIRAMELEGQVLEEPDELSNKLEREIDYGAAREFRIQETTKARAFVVDAIDRHQLS
jgi:hypothetical protein